MRIVIVEDLKNNKTILFKFLLVVLLSIQSVFSAAQNIKIARVDPPYWFTLMNNPKLQLCVYGPDIAKCKVSINYTGITLEKINKVENPNYLFLDLDIDMSTKTGVVQINFTNGNKSYNYPYELRSRVLANNKAKGINSSDLIYLIVPDRFANGNPTNDQIINRNEQGVYRDSTNRRHGGDLEGIIKNLPYLKFLGVTALWLTPVQENNQSTNSYRGNAITDYYKIDDRLGDLDTYIKLVAIGHNVGIKTIFDVVLYQVGDQNWFVKDLPSKDWIHQWSNVTQTNNLGAANMDLYASESDKKILTQVWEDSRKPRLNPQNIFLANYLIQNSIWWIETTGIDGYDIVDYTKTDLEFSKKWTKAIEYEYPSFSIFAQTESKDVLSQSFFTQNKMKEISFEVEVHGVTDFQLYSAINKLLNQKTSDSTGLNNLYQTLCEDYIYKDATKNVVFLDDQNLIRYYNAVGEDFAKWKMGLVFIMTTRGIPMIYYGTELLMKNSSANSAADFQGGLETDSVNKFKIEGRNASENEAYNFISKLANWRKNRPAIKIGKLMQFVPVDDVYVYFRYNKDQTIMVIMNNNNGEIVLDTKRFEERMQGFKTAFEVTSNVSLTSIEKIKVPANTALILELK